MSEVIREYRFEWAHEEPCDELVRYLRVQDTDEWKIDKIFSHPHGAQIWSELKHGTVQGKINYILLIISEEKP